MRQWEREARIDEVNVVGNWKQQEKSKEDVRYERGSDELIYVTCENIDVDGGGQSKSCWKYIHEDGRHHYIEYFCPQLTNSTQPSLSWSCFNPIETYSAQTSPGMKQLELN